LTTQLEPTFVQFCRVHYSVLGNLVYRRMRIAQATTSGIHQPITPTSITSAGAIIWNKLCGRPPQYALAPCKLTFDLLTLKVASESRVTWATSVPILVFPGLDFST